MFKIIRLPINSFVYRWRHGTKMRRNVNVSTSYFFWWLLWVFHCDIFNVKGKISYRISISIFLDVVAILRLWYGHLIWPTTDRNDPCRSWVPPGSTGMDNQSQWSLHGGVYQGPTTNRNDPCMVWCTSLRLVVGTGGPFLAWCVHQGLPVRTANHNGPRMAGYSKVYQS